jgi:hypothetical protein
LGRKEREISKERAILLEGKGDTIRRKDRLAGQEGKSDIIRRKG